MPFSILLVQTNRERSPQPVIPLGLGLVAAATEQAGHRVEVLDLCFLKDPAHELVERLRRSRYDVVGLSIRNLDTADALRPRNYLKEMRALVRAARQATKAPLVIGGPAVSIAPAALVEYLGADHAVAGEGEGAFPALLRQLESGGPRPGSVFSLEGGEEVAGCLAALRAVNRYLGGRYSALHDLKRLIARMPTLHKVTVLDIATGSADIPAALVRRAKQRGLDLSVTGVDIKEQVVRLAREWLRNFPEITLVQGDALRLPFKPRSFDFVLCCEFLHHLSTPQAAELLARIDKLARYGFVVTDLRRNWMAYGGIFVLTRLFTRSRLARHDGPVSVLRAFTPEELRVLAAEAGLRNTRLHLRPLFRMTLVGDKTGGLAPEMPLFHVEPPELLGRR